MAKHTVQCFVGQQVKPYGFEHSEPHNNGKLKWNTVTEKNEASSIVNLVEKVDQKPQKEEAKPDQHGPGKKNANGIRHSLIENGSGHHKNKEIKGTRAKKRSNMHLEHRPSDEMDLLIDAVNEANLGWKADTCKYTKTHAKYGEHCDAAEPEQTLTQLSTQLEGPFDTISLEELTTAL